jgi:protein O-mannosyl-transferase
MNAPPANALLNAPQVSRERISRLAVMILVLAGLAAYGNSMRDAFVFDDIDSIVGNPALQHLWPPWKFFESLNRPVLNLTLAFSYAFANYSGLAQRGLTVASFHAFNIAVHILAAVTLYALVRRTLTLPRLRARFGDAAIALALATALIWEVHPLQTESVTYVIQRAESLAGLFYLLTLYCVLRGADSGRPARWYAGAFACCAMGMGTKQTVATAPAVIFLYDWIFLSGSFLDTLRRRWPVYLALAATWVLVALSVASPAETQRVSAGFQVSGITPAGYAVTQLGVILHYLRLTFWPAGLCLDYDWPSAKGLADVLPGAIVVGALLAATVAALLLRPVWGFLGAWFFLILAPSSSFYPIADKAAEHRMYLSLSAVAAFVAIGGYVLFGRLNEKRRYGWTGLIVVAVLIVGVLGYLTALRNQDYRSELSIWDDTVHKAPNNPRAIDGRGRAYFEKHEYDRALSDHNAAIQLNEYYAPAYNSRAIVYNEMRQFGEALRDCDAAIALDPNLSVFHNTRGVVLARMGEYGKAIEDYGRAIALNPAYADAYMNRGVAWGKIGQLAEALTDFDKAIALNPNYPSAYYNRGNTYADRNDYDRAIADYSGAIALKSDYREAYLNRAVAHYGKKEYRAAWADVHRVLNLGEPFPKELPPFLRALTQAAPPE